MVDASSLYGLLNLPPSAGFPDIAPPVDEAAEAQKARDAAAKVLGRRGAARQDWGARGDATLPGVDVNDPAIQMALGNGPAPVPSAVAGPTIASQAPPMAPGSPAPALPPPINIAPPPGSTDEAALPPGATPTEGRTPTDVSAQSRQPAPDVPQTSLFGRIGKGLNENSNLLLSLAAGFGGAQSFGQGMGRAFGNAVQGGQLDQKIQNQNLTVNALVRRGLPPDLARAAATNPTILAQILPQAFGAKQRKFTQIGEDMMGNKQFGFVDEASGKAYDMTGKEIDHGSAGTTVPAGPDGNPLSGPALLAHLEKNDPVTAAGVKGLISGDLNAQGRNLQKLAPLAKLVDPTFDATQYPVRLATRKSYTSGKDFQETQALNTVGGHLGKLMDSADKLGNTNVPAFNKVQNWFADNFTGSPALVKFRNDLVTTSNELAKAYHGGHVSDSAYAAFNKAVNEAQTPAEMKAAIGELSGLLQSKIEAKESGYRSSMADAPLPSEYKAINDEAKHSFQRIGDWANGTAQPSAHGATAPVRVNSPAEAAKLPRGTHFLDPNGVERVVP